MEIVEREFGKANLSLETGRLARQANGSVLVRYGDTMVLVAATAAPGSGAGADFFPLSVFYVEKAYAAGRIPGGFFKREARLSDSETLISRIIDRPLRPSFHENYLAETLIVATVLSHDLEFPSDVAAMIGASAALSVSDIPLLQPIGGIRVGMIDGEFITNPNPEEITNSQMNIFMAGSRDAILMVEGEANEVSESVMLDALWYGHEQIQPIIDMQEELVQRCGKAKREVEAPAVDEDLKKKVYQAAPKKIQKALQIKEKQERYASLDEASAEIVSEVGGEEADESVVAEIKTHVAEIKKKEMREKLIKDQVRIDGRTPTEIRPITCETRVLPRTHGSAVFTRGETQALGVTTLGTREDEQMIDALPGLSYKNFMLHYNFPSFSVGETRPPRGPGRREIGHGTLAERSLSMMDAGIPLKRATAGIAMGLISEGDDMVILSDILGDEDHLGDMDFKVVGTSEGITALQMDIKIRGLSREIVEKSLNQARDGRLHILDIMNASMEEPRNGLSSFAPRFITHKIPRDMIGKVIGPGGKVIKDIVEKTGVKMNIDDDGIVSIASRDHKAVDVALDIVRDLTRTVEIGQTYSGPVKKVMDFGAFVELFPGTEGLVHISNLAPQRVNAVTDICREGDIVTVKAMGMDKRGKLQLSMKDVEEAA